MINHVTLTLQFKIIYNKLKKCVDIHTECDLFKNQLIQIVLAKTDKILK